MLEHAGMPIEFEFTATPEPGPKEVKDQRTEVKKAEGTSKFWRDVCATRPKSEVAGRTLNKATDNAIDL